jgi:P pilus assembly chaperone PapD
MRGYVAVIALAAAAPALAGCGPRQVEVRTAPASQAEVSIQVNNTLSQAVNVYVTTGGSDLFLRQVGANTRATLPVRGLTAGTTVTLRATTVDGGRQYERRNVVLQGTYAWVVP